MIVSILVPNYNHLKFLPIRIQSIFNQTFQDFELVLLDDCSTDGSWEFLESFTDHPKVSHCIRNEINSGSPFHQWRKGIELAKGEMIWIAESDDWADPHFLEECISLMKDNHLSLVMSGSYYVDSEGKTIGEVVTDFKKGIFDGNRFCIDLMYSKNTVLNASAVIFSKDALQSEMLEKILDFKLSGDHLFWVQVMKDQRIGILDQKLNYFRWHPAAVRVTESGNLTELLEGIRIKNWMERNFRIESSRKFQARREAYLVYFKSLTSRRNPKKRTEFFSIWAFFNPLDKFKSLIRYFLV